MRRKTIVLYSLASIIFSLGFCSSAFCIVRYVNSEVQVSGLGTSWSTAIKDLKTAIDRSIDDDEVWVKCGVYKEDNLLVSNKIKIYGGFIGNENNIQDRDWDANETIIEPYSMSSPAAHIFSIFADATVDGIIISNGGHGSDDGGGIYVDGCSVEIRNTTFSGNKGIAGGAIYSNTSSSLNITNCNFDSNEADYGGAINSAGELLIKKCKFSYNRALDGGAINSEAKSSQISACYFHGNRATNGAAIFFFPSLGRNIVRNSIFYINYAQEDGGAIYLDESLINIIHCTFHRNTANLDGGAIFYRPVDQGALIEPKIINSIFWHNVDFDFLGNYQYNSIFVDGNNNFWPISLYNTIIDDLDIEDWGIGENIINADPKLDNTPDRPLHLKLGSPCIDACEDIIEGGTGFDFTVSPVPELVFDFDGDPRIMGNKPDIGADELIVVDVDIKPGSCPNRIELEDDSKLMVALLGSRNFNINRVDPESVKLLYQNRSISTKSIFADFGKLSRPVRNRIDECDCTRSNDRYKDYLVEIKLKNLKIFSKLKIEDHVLKLHLEGFLNDGSPFRGIDCLNIEAILP